MRQRQELRLLRHASAAHVSVRIPWAAPFSQPVEIEISGVRVTLNLEAAMAESPSPLPLSPRAARGAPALPEASSGASRYPILLLTSFGLPTVCLMNTHSFYITFVRHLAAGTFPRGYRQNCKAASKPSGSTCFAPFALPFAI